MSDADDPDAPDDPGLRSMRAVWLSMRDEEPPAAGLSGLLAAAREKADAMRPKDPWWQRALVVLRRPPVLALASVVVLLGGAVALTMRGDDLATESPQSVPVPESRAKQEAPAPAAVAPTPPAPQPQDPQHERAETETKKDVQAPARPPVVHRAPPRTTVAQGADVPGRAAGDEYVKSPEPPRELPSKEPDTKAEGGLAIATDGRSPTVGGEAAPPAANDTIETTGGATRGQTSTAQLVQQCETAAARGDCAATRVTAAKIKKLDAAVYKARIQSNQSIARCLK